MTPQEHDLQLAWKHLAECEVEHRADEVVAAWALIERLQQRRGEQDCE